jgi:hypothetical protein
MAPITRRDLLKAALAAAAAPRIGMAAAAGGDGKRSTMPEHPSRPAGASPAPRAAEVVAIRGVAPL